jgi:hypothetical protein
VPDPNTGFVAISAGTGQSLGLKADGSIVAWGDNRFGQCNVPAPNTGFVAVSAGWDYNLGIKADGSVADNPAMRSAKLQTDGVFANVYGGIISAAWPDEFYIESDNRTCGLLVKKTGHGFAQGKRVNVAGTVSTNTNGERYIDASFVLANQSGTIKPLGMNNRALGGADWFFDEGAGTGQKGVLDGFGLNNIGLLVRVWGKVTEIEKPKHHTTPTWFKIDDGSGVSVKCVVPTGVRIRHNWKYVGVTGVSSCEKIEGNLYRLIRVRDLDDIIPY